MRDLFITSSIPYVNAAPHLGHVLEFVQADVLARHRRSRGADVRYQSGTDDHAAKNVVAAQLAGIEVGEYVAANAERFQALAEPFELSFDDFISTSSDARHEPGVIALWQASSDAGDFYKKTWQGLYCGGCEGFYTADELVDGRCVEHDRELEVVAEENWFFRLSRYQEAIKEALVSGRVRVEPATKLREVLNVLDSGLDDISVSRPASRSQGWGIAVPDDESQRIYVWWEALCNYVTTLGQGVDLERWWQGDTERIHVIGKGITRFHAIYWLGLLLSAGLELPDAIFVHEYLTVDGAKIAKSSGKRLDDPLDVVDVYGVDALRWWLVRDVARVGDTNFSTERLVRNANEDLAGGFGNLVARWRALNAKVPQSVSPTPVASTLPLKERADLLAGRIDGHLARFDLRSASGELLDAVTVANRYLDTTRPWELVHCDPGAARAAVDAVGTLCETIVSELKAFLPSGAARLHRCLTGSTEVPFPRLDTEKKA